MIIFQALKKVFSQVRYTVIAGSISVFVFVFAVLFPNIGLIAGVITDPEISFAQKLELPWNLLGGVITNFTLFSASYTITIAILFGMNIAMFAYYIRRRIDDIKQGGIATGFLGIASGTLGLGCAACGTFVLTTILPIFGAGSLLAFLPLGGGEFGILGVVLLSVSIYLTAKQIQNPAVCKIN